MCGAATGDFSIESSSCIRTQNLWHAWVLHFSSRHCEERNAKRKKRKANYISEIRTCVCMRVWNETDVGSFCSFLSELRNCKRETERYGVWCLGRGFWMHFPNSIWTREYFECIESRDNAGTIGYDACFAPINRIEHQSSGGDTLFLYLIYEFAKNGVL